MVTSLKLYWIELNRLCFLIETHFEYLPDIYLEYFPTIENFIWLIVRVGLFFIIWEAKSIIFFRIIAYMI